MSDILARLRVRETHGIRRFLYPLSVSIPIGESALKGLHLKTFDGQVLPSAVGSNDGVLWLDFAISLPPLVETELFLAYSQEVNSTVPDPLTLSRKEALVTSTQERFAITFAGLDSFISSVVYDGTQHLRGPCTITHNGIPIKAHVGTQWRNNPLVIEEGSLEQRNEANNQNGVLWDTRIAVTAYKSWANVSHVVIMPQPNDEIVFALPLAIASPTLTCDFGVGGSVFGKLDSKATEVVWHTEFGDAPYAKWTVATAGRVDYVGEVDSTEAFLPQRWFHLIDSDKALAVAITRLPDGCQSMTVRLTNAGDVSVTFKLGDKAKLIAEFGVCYHFLNDVPAIAAATNPQSILLPPIVEVLPVM